MIGIYLDTETMRGSTSESSLATLAALSRSFVCWYAQSIVLSLEVDLEAIDEVGRTCSLSAKNMAEAAIGAGIKLDRGSATTADERPRRP